MREAAWCARLLAVMGWLATLSVATAQAQQLYKWVDENGVTHFSVQPPAPATVAPEEVEDASVSFAASGSASLWGTWWAQPASMRGQFLKLSSGSFSIERRFIERAYIRSERIASGLLQRDANALVLTYFNHKVAAKLDQVERFSVMRVTDTELELLHPDKVVPVLYRRLQSGNSNPLSVRLRGRWQVLEKPGRSYTFSSSTYTFGSQVSSGSRHAIQEGNWSWEDPDLVLKPVMTLSPMTEHGESRWYLANIGANSIDVVDRRTNDKFTLKRIQ